MKKTRIIIFIILFLTVQLTAVLNAAERQPILWSIRSMGMGGAGIVVANTDDALLFNPACVSYIPGPKLTINPLSAGIDQAIVGELGYIAGDLIQEILSMEDVTDLTPGLKAWVNSDHNIGIDPGFNLSFVSPLKFKNYTMGIGFGIYGNAIASIGIGQGVWSPTLNLKATADAIGMGTAAFDIFLPVEAINPITVGISAKYLLRAKVDKYESLFSLLMESIAGDESFFMDYAMGLLQTGSGFGLDLGFLYKWCDGDVGLGLTIKNLGGLKLGYKSGQEIIPRTVNLGWGCNYGRLILACDIHDILTVGNLPKKIHLGAEYPIGSLLFLRGGFSSGWPTAGGRLALDLILIRLYVEYAYTANEIGTYAGQWANYYHRASMTLQFF